VTSVTFFCCFLFVQKKLYYLLFVYITSFFIHLANYSDKPAVVSFLIESGAEVDVRESKFGFTPIFAAIVDGGKGAPKSVDCLKLLLANGIFSFGLV
jgi:hypothetical protein